MSLHYCLSRISPNSLSFVIPPKFNFIVSSEGAGGLWMPYKCNDCRIDQWALETLDELLELSSLVNNAGAAVEIVPALVLLRENDTHVNNPPLWTKDSRIKFQTITPEILWLVLVVCVGIYLSVNDARDCHDIVPNFSSPDKRTNYNSQQSGGKIKFISFVYHRNKHCSMQDTTTDGYFIHQSLIHQ